MTSGCTVKLDHLDGVTGGGGPPPPPPSNAPAAANPPTTPPATIPTPIAVASPGPMPPAPPPSRCALCAAKEKGAAGDGRMMASVHVNRAGARIQRIDNAYGAVLHV